MELEPGQALEQVGPVCLDLFVCPEQVYQTGASFSRLVLDHMTSPHNPPEQEMALQQLGNKHQEPELPARDMAEPACTQRTSDQVDRREGHRVTALVPCKDTVVRMPLVVGTDCRLVLVLVVQ